MAPEAAESHEPQPASPPRRRILFPWAWVGLLVGARLAFQLTAYTADFKAVATLVLVGLISFGLAIWYLIRGRASWPVRLAVGAAPFVLFGGCNLLFEPQFNGASAIVGLHRRGTPKADQQIESISDLAPTEGLADWGPGPYDYPRFLGTGPWAEATGEPLATDWDAQPPVELWRRPVGAGWSSFAVYGRYAITQEQRGEEELVVCYDTQSGEPAWSHADLVRFDPQGIFDLQAAAGQMGRQGPRATPTIVEDRVFTQGGKGLVNCLDARTGQLVWQVDTSEAYGATTPVWGKSGSPLFVPAAEEEETDLIVINVGAPEPTTDNYDASLVAFDAATGEEVWSAGSEQTSYSSPQLVTLHDRRVVLQTVDELLVARDVATGKLLFDYPWSGRSADRPSCSQPIDLGDNRLLLTKGYGHGASLLMVSLEGDDWKADPSWAPAIKPVLQTKFSNPVLRGDHAYALNGEMLQCVEVATGDIAWRKRRRPKFGFGQVLLTKAGLLVMSEESGELVLVEATPERYRELAAIQVLAESETCWNNPVVAGDLLLVRNAVEAAAYRLPLAVAAPPEATAGP